MTKGRTVTIAAALFVLACGIVVGAYRGSGAFFNQYDDGYITYRYAAHLARGEGLVFNLGERTDSASSTSFALLLALFYRLGVHDLEAVAAALSIGCVGGTAVLVFLGGLAWSRSAVLSAGAALLCAAHGLISGWAVSGMDTLFFAFLVALFVYLQFTPRARSGLPAAVLCLLVITRLESVLLLLAWLAMNAGEASAADPAARRRFLSGVAAVGLVVVAYFAFKLSYYRTAIPHALQLKDVWLAYQARPAAMVKIWRETSIALVLLGAGGLRFVPDVRARFVLGGYLVATAASVLLGPFADWGRYSTHLVPILFMLAPLSLSYLFVNARWLAIPLSVLLVYETGVSLLSTREFMAWIGGHQRCRKEVGRFVASLHPEGPVLSSDLGAIAYTAPGVRFLDAVGLTSADVLDVYVHGGDLAAVLAARRPVLVADTVYPRGEDGHGEYQAVTLLRTPSRYLLTEVPGPTDMRPFREAARLFQCRSPDGRLFAVGRLASAGERPADRAE